MENVIIVAIIAVVCIFGIKNYSKRLTQGCCGTGSDEKKVRVQDKDKAHYPYCVKLGIEGMTCGHCKERVENALNKEEGVWAQVDLKEGSAIVRMKQEIAKEDLERIIQRAGYTMTGMETLGAAAV